MAFCTPVPFFTAPTPSPTGPTLRPTTGTYLPTRALDLKGACVHQPLGYAISSVRPTSSARSPVQSRPSGLAKRLPWSLRKRPPRPPNAPLDSSGKTALKPSANASDVSTSRPRRHSQADVLISPAVPVGYGCCDEYMASMAVVGGRGGAQFNCSTSKVRPQEQPRLLCPSLRSDTRQLQA